MRNIEKLLGVHERGSADDELGVRCNMSSVSSPLVDFSMSPPPVYENMCVAVCICQILWCQDAEFSSSCSNLTSVAISTWCCLAARCTSVLMLRHLLAYSDLLAICRGVFAKCRILRCQDAVLELVRKPHFPWGFQTCAVWQRTSVGPTLEASTLGGPHIKRNHVALSIVRWCSVSQDVPSEWSAQPLFVERVACIHAHFDALVVTCFLKFTRETAHRGTSIQSRFHRWIIMSRTLNYTFWTSYYVCKCHISLVLASYSIEAHRRCRAGSRYCGEVRLRWWLLKSGTLCLCICDQNWFRFFCLSLNLWDEQLL